MLRLKVFDGLERVANLRLGDGAVSFGRSEDCTLTLPDLSVSRNHAEIFPHGHFYLLRDNDSTNGTFVNELAIRSHVLTHGDTIRIGKYLVQVDAKPSNEKDSTRVRIQQVPLLSQAEADAAPVSADEPTLGRDDTLDMPPMAHADFADPAAEQLRRLTEVHEALAHVSSSESLLERIVDLLLENVDADCGSVLLTRAKDDAIDPDELYPCVVRRRGPLPTGGHDNDELIIPKAVVEQVSGATHGIVGRVPIKNNLTTSCLACPVEDHHGAHGILYLERDGRKSPFTNEDLHFVMTVCRQLAGSLSNARLFAEITGEREKIRTVFASLTDGVLVTNAEFEVTEANRAAVHLLNLASLNPLGRGLFSLFDAFEVRPGIPVLKASCHRAGVVFQLLRRGSSDRADRTGRFISGTISPYPREQEPQGFVLTLQDHSQDRHVEELKTHFMERIGHKLRTPLTVIQANLPLLSSETDPETMEAICADVQENSDQLARLVNAFVEFIELEVRSDTISGEPSSLRVRTLLKSMTHGVRPSLEEKRVLLVDEIPEDLPAVAFHENVFSKVVREILDNAAKFVVDNGRVTVSADTVDGFLRIDIIDDGPGIPEAERESVFYVCHQIDEEHTGQVPGAGLGLTLARHLMRKEGGEIQIASPFRFPDRGTCVSLYFPLAESESEVQPAYDFIASE